MNIIGAISSNTIFQTCLMLPAGYIANYSLLSINQIAAKKLQLPIDICEGKDYKDYTAFYSNTIENAVKRAREIHDENSKENSTQNFDEKKVREKYFSVVFNLILLTAIREEFSFRYLWEDVLLPTISSQFTQFSFLRTAVSTKLFALAHLRNNVEQGAKAGQFINTVILGIISSIVKYHLGILGAILFHLGYNFFGFQYMYGINLSETIRLLLLIIQSPFNEIEFKVTALINNFILDLIPLHLIPIQQIPSEEPKKMA